MEISYRIRAAGPEDAGQAAAVEASCFPAAEAAGEEALSARIKTYPDSFLVAEAAGKLIGFINGAVTNERTIRDEMFEDVSLHVPDGDYQAVFGLDVLSEYRRFGIGADLMKHLIRDAKDRGRKGLILTCKDHLIHYYEKFGYRSLGVSRSVHGGAVWYDMILEFETEEARA